jgi:prepilin signal peptidase PulO-like enzyme (type II secretory pathway)
MPLLPNLPSELHLLAVFALGVFAASIVNWAIYSLRFEPIATSPWSRAHPSDAHDSWRDRLPLIGWWRLRRKGKLLGYEFWIRPLVIELLCGLIAAGLYSWEVLDLGLAFDIAAGAQVQPGQPLPPPMPPIATLEVVHAQFVAHVLLALFLVAATFIDLDELTIPDEVTVPGTLLGLVLLATVPPAALPDVPVILVNPEGFSFDPLPRGMNIASPWEFPDVLHGPAGLALGLGCYWLWCAALLPRRWRGRHGWRRAMQLIGARIAREKFSLLLLALAMVGGAGIAGVWALAGPERWASLASSLVGIAVGGGFVWMIRIIGYAALRREAMGFGDVTLMSMIGAYLGWQAALVGFMLAPFIGLALTIGQYILRRDNVIPFGPYISLGTLVAIVCWRPIWLVLYHYFAAGLLMPTVIGLVLFGLYAGLWAIRMVRGRGAI